MKKGNIIALLAFLVAVVLVFTLKTQQTRAIQSWVLGVLSPFIRGGAQAEQQVREVMAGTPDPVALQEENERLRQEVEKLRIIAVEMLRGPDHMAMRRVKGARPWKRRRGARRGRGPAAAPPSGRGWSR